MVTLIGDIHGKIDRYYKIIRKRKYSIQLGDFGFHKEWEWLNKNVDSNNHKVLRGNHDIPNRYPHDLGDFGTINHGGISFWFLRGAYSIDKAYRMEGSSWFPEEECDYSVMYNAYLDYKIARPHIVISHEAPSQIKAMLINETPRDKTSICLGQCLDFHVPKLWVFGHHHQSIDLDYLGCHFKCLNELETFECT